MSTRLPGFTVEEEPLFIGEKTIILRGIEDRTERNIVIKLLKIEYPTPNQITRFKHEYEITKIFENSKHIVHAYEFKKHENSYAIIMEHINAPSLKEVLDQEHKLKLDAFLAIAIQMAEALGHIHEHQIIHKDINVNNIMCDLSTKEIRIIDFGLSADIPRERAEIVNPNVLEGTLAYLSPEQTGRMNRGVDYRTDYYSLGVTFYHMITGELPFSSDDAMELVHSHIAVLPKSPHEIDPSVPEVVSAIIMKLLSKTVEERYQNSNGLIADLRRCQEQLLTHGKIEPFPLGTKDVFSRFQIPEKLYGREREVNTLVSAYDRVMHGGVELMLVSGYSGIGKSALVHEIHKPIVHKNGYFISGKFDQFKHNIPYAAISQAFDELVKKILTESEERIDQFRKRILAAVKENGQIILDVIPNLIRIIGEQPPVLELGPTESLNRFGHIFQNFIKSLATSDHPLVIFFDDLQWADLPSLKMLETLLTSPDCNYLFIIGAFRSNEVTEGHPLMTTWGVVKEQNIKHELISLGPISVENVCELIADTLHQKPEDVSKLAQLCYEKTGGNPFFLIQLLLMLYKEQLIEFDSQKNQWIWHLEKIQKKRITDNIVELMVQKIRELTPKAQRLLQLAACIGTQFNLDLLSKIDGKEPEQVLIEIQEILKEGYVLAHGEGYRAESFYFTHDRIQQAASSLLEEDERKILHINLARILLNSATPDKLSEILFDVVNHYNFGLEPDVHPTIDANERRELAKLDLQAAKLAMSAAAFEPAQQYIDYSLRYLNEQSWQSDYAFTLDVYNTATESALFTSKHALVAEYAAIIAKHAKNIFDELPTIQMRIFSNATLMKPLIAAEIAVETLNRFGMKIPFNPTKLQILFAVARVKFFLKGRKIPDLVNLPVISDQTVKAIIFLISSVYSSAYESNPDLFAYLVCTSVIQSIRYGNTKGSAYSYLGYAIILCGALDDINAGYQCSELAVKLMEKMHDQEWNTKIVFAKSVFVNHWKDPIQDVCLKFIENFESGIDAGDFEFAGYSLIGLMIIKFHFGDSLQDILSNIEKYMPRLIEIKHVTSNYYLSICHQAVLNLIERQDRAGTLKGKAFDEEKMLPIILKSHDKTITSNFYIHKVALSYLFEQYDDAMEHIKQCHVHKSATISMVLVPPFYFYEALTLLAIYPTSSIWEKIKISWRIKTILKQFNHWTKFAPHNQLQRTLLISAEWARVRGKEKQASNLYDKAIAAAKENKFINEEALANELAARFYLAQGKDRFARTYIQEARYCYLLWGAKAKVAQLDERYPTLLKKIEDYLLLSRQNRSVRGTSTGTTTTEGLDIGSVLKSSQAILSTIVLEDLLKSLMHIVVENAGAQKSYLLLNKKGRFVIEAEGDANHEEVKVLQSIPVTNDVLPSSIINYVIRSEESIVLDHASRSGPFVTDPYIIREQTKSVLCMPLINQGILSGVLYMENNLIEGTFTGARITMLNLLSSEMAISINNARLYDQLIVLNKAYERFVPSDFLNLLHKNSISDIALGDHTQITMSVLFADIRNFTSLSEKMTPEENYSFVNSYIKYIAPAIEKNHGFIDKYIGDAILALFYNPQDAFQASLDIQNQIVAFNNDHSEEEYYPVACGIGLHSGTLMLGIVGVESRLQGTVISDAVNLCARLQDLAATTGVLIAASKSFMDMLDEELPENVRFLGNVYVKGKEEATPVFEVISIGNDPHASLKIATKPLLHEGLDLFFDKKFAESGIKFKLILEQNPEDGPVQKYLQLAAKFMVEGTPAGWKGVYLSDIYKRTTPLKI